MRGQGAQVSSLNLESDQNNIFAGFEALIAIVVVILVSFIVFFVIKCQICLFPSQSLDNNTNTDGGEIEYYHAKFRNASNFADVQLSRQNMSNKNNAILMRSVFMIGQVGMRGNIMNQMR